MVQHQLSNELESMIKKKEVQAGPSGNSPQPVPAADPAVYVFAMFGSLLFWAVNHMTSGALSIIPGHPTIDDIIVGIIIGVFIMYSKLKKIRKLQEIQEIQEDLAHQEKQKADQFSTDLLQRHLAHSNDINV
jgi:hypothetical protein